MTISKERKWPVPTDPAGCPRPDNGPRNAVVAAYRTHSEAESAIGRLSAGGLPESAISIIGRDFQTRDDVHGFYHPAHAAVSGAEQGSWYGGIFGIFAGAMAFFVFPAMGSLMILGPIAGMMAGAIGGAGVGALVKGLCAAGVSRRYAVKYQERLKAGEFLVFVHGAADEALRAHEILELTDHTHLQAHSPVASPGATVSHRSDACLNGNLPGTVVGATHVNARN